MRILRQALVGLTVVALAATAAQAAEKKQPGATKPKLFTLTSPAMKDDAMLPVKYAGAETCGAGSPGKNVSPPLAWANAPPSTKSFALMIVDPDGRRGLGSVHWIAYNIPANLPGDQRGRRQRRRQRHHRWQKLARYNSLYRAVRAARRRAASLCHSVAGTRYSRRHATTGARPRRAVEHDQWPQPGAREHGRALSPPIIFNENATGGSAC